MDAKRIRLLCSTAAAAALGRRDLLSPLYSEALQAGIELRDLQETTLQVFLFAGYPRTIVAFEALSAAAPCDAPPPTEPDRPDLDKRGRELFARIYGPHTDRVLDLLRSLHPDFQRYVVRDAYGQVLARPFLPVEERELLAVAMLGAMGLGQQLREHVRGALNVGATREQVETALEAIEPVTGAEAAAQAQAVAQEELSAFRSPPSAP